MFANRLMGVFLLRAAIDTFYLSAELLFFHRMPPNWWYHMCPVP